MASAPDKPSREQLEADWWKRWWAADFSWVGLAKKPIAGTGGIHGEKTLQDYWRRDPANPTVVRDDAAMEAAGELIRAPDGKLWHLAHVPLAWKDGSPAKSAWNDTRTSRLRDLVTARLMAGAETKAGKEKLWQVSGPDGRAQLSGSVFNDGGFALPTQDSLNTIHTSCENVWFLGVEASGRTFGALSSFAGATFSGTAGFDSATFSGTAWFSSATFSGYARFDSATFCGDAWFYSATFSGPAWFYSATFSGTAWFYSATFSGDAWFDRATFSGDAGFSSATFSGYTWFDSATFSGDAGFSSATFSGDTWFDSATFERQFWFFNARMQGICRFDGTIWPTAARHWHRAFDAAIFSAPVSFRGAKRSGHGANETFIPHAAFDGASFERPPAFDVVTEQASKANFEVSLQGAIAAAQAQANEWAESENKRLKDKPPQNSTANKDTLPTAPKATDSESLSLGRFREEDDADESQSMRNRRMAMADVPVERGDPISTVRFSRTRRPRHPWFETGFLGALADWQENLEIASKREDLYRRLVLARLTELERGCRVLKTEMAKATDKTREQMFFRYELRARAAQSSTPIWERILSDIYQLTSDYGTSVGKPLAALLVVTLVFAILFTAFGYRPDTDGLSQLGEGFDFSLSNVFRPFQALAEPEAGAKGLSGLFASDDYGAWAKAGIRFLSGLQSFASLVILFLFALAVRRRFQIN